MRWVRVVCIAIAWLLFAGPARALTVAILEPPSPTPALREAVFRLQGELLAVGLEVTVTDRQGPGAVPFDDGAGFDAIIEVVGSVAPTAVDVWILRGPGGDREVQRVELDPDAADPSETLAIRAIEVLRARFVEFDLELRRKEQAALPAPAPPPTREAPTRSQPPRKSPRSWTGLALGAVAVVGVDRVGPALLPLVRFEWAPHWPVALQTTLAGLGTEPTIRTEAGRLRLAQQYGVVGLSCCPAFDSGMEPLVSLSAGALRTELDGEGTPPNVGHEVQSWAFLLEGSFGVRLPIVGPYFSTFSSHVQLAEPHVAIHVPDSVVATSGRPNLLLSLTVGAGL